MLHLLTVPTKQLPGHDGRPAFLARAVLAALLGATPEKLTNLFSNYQRRKEAQVGPRAIARVVAVSKTGVDEKMAEHRERKRRGRRST